MTKVISQVDNKTKHMVDDELLKDFFYECLVADETGDPLIRVLLQYKPNSRSKLCNYIVHRLAEVSPGYLPSV